MGEIQDAIFYPTDTIGTYFTLKKKKLMGQRIICPKRCVAGGPQEIDIYSFRNARIVYSFTQTCANRSYASTSR